MDFMKVIDQTVREIKREVNLKVLKVPEIEQKVLDATDDEPWGPHGSALAEIAQATKKYSECQMVMNVLWTRLSETGRNWRYVYKALAVIEYLVSNGSERAVDDIIEHTYQISALASFEYVEPNGKDNGINVRKKAENIVTLLNNKDKIQEVRNKAAANRDKYFGLSSSGVTFKSGAASFTSSSSRSSDRYGGFGGSGESETYRDAFNDEETFEKFTSNRSCQGTADENQESSLKKGSAPYGSKGGSSKSSVSLGETTSIKTSDKSSSVPTRSSSALPSNTEDDFDDFDPRGTSSTKSAVGNSNQVDLFGQSMVGDLLNIQSTVPKDTYAGNSDASEVDLFADADFVSAPSPLEAGGSSQNQAPVDVDVDLFASQPAPAPAPASASSSVGPPIDFFAAPDPVVHSEKNSSKSDLQNTNAIDPFASVPLNSFDGSDLLGSFTSNTNSASTEATKVQEGIGIGLDGNSSTDPKLPSKSNTFQVKSGIWADSLNRGLIDLNISAPKKVSLADVGIVGGLSDGVDEIVKGPPTSYMGRAMGMGSGLGKSGFAPSTGAAGDNLFSSLGSQQYQFGGFQK